MSILGYSPFKYTTEWEFETSEDKTGSIFASVSVGRLVLRSTVSGAKMTIKYTCLSAGLSKGLPVGYAESSFSDPSRGHGPLFSNKYVSSFDFPCKGYILGLGVTLGAFQEGKDPNGGNMNIFLFGLLPFAGLRCSGAYHATTPGGGVGGGFASFSLE
jgi:hypothetical protein